MRHQILTKTKDSLCLCLFPIIASGDTTMTITFAREIDPVAIYAAIVSTIVFVWQIFVWLHTGPRLKVSTSANMVHRTMMIPPSSEVKDYVRRLKRAQCWHTTDDNHARRNVRLSALGRLLAAQNFVGTR